jgi:hypothetical protein
MRQHLSTTIAGLVAVLVDAAALSACDPSGAPGAKPTNARSAGPADSGARWNALAADCPQLTSHAGTTFSAQGNGAFGPALDNKIFYNTTCAYASKTDKKTGLDVTVGIYRRGTAGSTQEDAAKDLGEARTKALNPRQRGGPAIFADENGIGDAAFSVLRTESGEVSIYGRSGNATILLRYTYVHREEAKPATYLDEAKGKLPMMRELAADVLDDLR